MCKKFGLKFWVALGLSKKGSAILKPRQAVYCCVYNTNNKQTAFR